MLNIAIIGCGKIADDHATQIQRIPGCRIVAVCDREPLMAEQLCERFGLSDHFSDIEQMLQTARPDVVHVTTPPESHFVITKMCLESGRHVYVEKPFTLNASEARDLISLADAKGLKLTVGHDEQYNHVSRRMRSLVGTGFLGGQPVHMESYYCYQLDANAYAGALLADRGHWVRRLPGKLLQNIISHGIARIAEFLGTESPTVIAHGFTSGPLRRVGETEIIDEARVIISEDQRTTAYFTFSSQMRPALRQFRLYGPQNGLILDQDTQTLLKLRGTRYPSYAEKFVSPVELSRQYVSNLAFNMRRFIANDFHMKAGMKCLIESFYRSIINGDRVPIPYREILLTATLMDAIFSQLDAQSSLSDTANVNQDTPCIQSCG